MMLAEGRRLADAACTEAARRRLAIAVAVVDEFGTLVQLDRMDGAAPVTPSLAEAKALTSLNWQRPTSELAGAVPPDALAALEQLVGFSPLVIPGGQPVLAGGRMIGALGVAGVSASDDREIAELASRAGAIVSGQER